MLGCYEDYVVKCATSNGNLRYVQGLGHHIPVHCHGDELAKPIHIDVARRQQHFVGILTATKNIVVLGGNLAPGCHPDKGRQQCDGKFHGAAHLCVPAVGE